MKVGIVTFFNAANYGAMLQAYALWQFLRHRGHEVEFISCAINNCSSASLWKCFVARSLRGVRIKLKRYIRHSITSFSQEFPQTRPFRNLEEVRDGCRKFDAVIVGSDQVWNPLWCAKKEFLPIVFLDFVTGATKRIAYAASFGVTRWSSDITANTVGGYLRKFDAISVREQSGLKVLHDLLERNDASCVLDPTMLFGCEFYQSMILKCKGVGVFKYCLDEWSDGQIEDKVVAEIQAALNEPRISTDKACVNGMLYPICKALKVDAKVSVISWLSKLANAEFVVTNSFHGTVFAILFHRPFVSILLNGKLSGMNERILSLLDMLHLRTRAVHSCDHSEIANIVSSGIDWRDVDSRLSRERDNAIRFVRCAGL